MTQNERLLDHLDKYGSITQLEALNLYGVGHLASRICELRKEGAVIERRMETVKNRFGEKVTVARYYATGGTGDGKAEIPAVQ